MPPNNKRRAVSLVKTILQDILHSPSLDDFKDAPHSTLRALPAFDVRAPVPLAGPTSWQALVSDGKPQKDRRVCSSSAVAVARGGSTRHWVLSDVRAERWDDQVYDTSVEFESWNDGMQKELKEPVGIFATFGVIDKPIDPPIGAGSTRPSTCQPPTRRNEDSQGHSQMLLAGPQNKSTICCIGVASAAAELLCWYSLVDMCPSRTTLSVLWGAFYLHQGLHVRLEWKSNGDRGKSFAVLTDKESSLIGQKGTSRIASLRLRHE
ncbi:hypothetical protein PF010_g19441 [Phytophthora fragariae]|uniref:Uncharacterized protein n=1 Tax=Phytophthora fragariae TaxID=53985 RepID=A0A6A4CHR4_9STRA|nr:hypothetical protein PF010_g19441 [Phytophthora fragariae]KAE9291408.1 hypothetical protein PF001_g19172 [Phytophthora fragariae]